MPAAAAAAAVIDILPREDDAIRTDPTRFAEPWIAKNTPGVYVQLKLYHRDIVLNAYYHAFETISSRSDPRRRYRHPLVFHFWKHPPLRVGARGIVFMIPRFHVPTTSFAALTSTWETKRITGQTICKVVVERLGIRFSASNWRMDQRAVVIVMSWRSIQKPLFQLSGLFS